MSCNLATTQAAACSSGIGKLNNPVQLLQVIAQNFASTALATTPSNLVDVASIQTRACVSGIGKITDEVALWRIIAQNLCGQINAVVPVTCDTVTISGAGTSLPNQVYTKVSETHYNGQSDAVAIDYDSNTGLWSILGFSGGTLYTQSGEFPTNWTVVNGDPPAPTGACS